MKITVWGINYDPEPTGIGPFNTDLCVYLAERGHDVTMISTFPYYPRWKKPDNARGKLFEKSILKGVKLYRCWHYVPAKPSTLKRLIHEMSFVTTSTLRALFLPAADVYIMISPPLFLGLGLFVVSRLKRRPFLVHVQDLQPDAALGLGMIKPGLSVRALYALEKWNYTLAARVSGISQGMLQAFAKKKVPAEKIVMYPNWIPDEVPAARGGDASFRAANGIQPTTPLIAYSGNVGVKQGLEAVVHAAALAKELGKKSGDAGPAIHWAICGEGAAKPALEKVAQEKGLVSVKLYPLQPDDLYHAMLREADISLITQQRGTGQFFFPSKLLSILQYGRPVLAVADDTSELSRAVAEGKFGLVVEPGDSAALLNAAQTMLNADQAQRDQWAVNGRKWVDQFRRTRVLGEFEDVLRDVAARP
ncbi:MAG TPA: WcaI family glycosyltransferase [Opitutaceae bacterium]|nr:WcaI family glycosyltransferase [Opitutaceae bacterium]